ncbi:MAG: hypothetical protein JXA11_03480 [Phycisphaerae bacterium]|nr:hypothetical protein [Phycisphaerae bacterium]
MKHAMSIIVVLSVIFFCARWNAGWTQPQPSLDENQPVQIASRATGLTFQSSVEKIRGGEIDWTRGVVCAVGIGKAREDFSGKQAEVMAKRGAYIIAARNAALVLAGIRVGPGGRFENVRNGWIRADVTLTGFRELGATYDPATRTATARMEIPLCGIRGAVGVLGLEEIKTTRRWTWPKSTTGSDRYDVIVIDARGLSCRPVVLPRIATVDGQCVFDAAEILADGSLRRPAARYASLPRKAILPPRAEKHRRRCLTVRAAKISTDGAIVLDAVNLDRLTCAPETQQTLRRGNLVIVTDG